MISPMMQLDIAKLHQADLLHAAQKTVILNQLNKEKYQERKITRLFRARKTGRLMAMVIYMLGF